MARAAKKVEDVYPLSPMQEGMLFQCLYEAGAELYVTQFACRIRRLEPGSFERAWQRVIGRHPVLRTGFVWEGVPKPVQVVGRQVSVPIEHEDWRGCSADEQERRLEALLPADRGRGFQLSKAPLMRLILVRTAADEHLLVWSHHHLLLDGWSVSLVLREVFACYRAALTGEEAHLEAPRPYRDYIAWLQRRDPARAERFWRRTLAGFSEPTRLELDDGRSAAPEGVAVPGLERRRLDAATTGRLRALAGSRRLTLNTLVQGAWGLLLGRYTGRDDVLFGAVVSGRPPALEGVERMVGLFINTLPVRVRIVPAVSIADWLEQLQEQQTEQRELEHTPLVEVRRWSDLPPGGAMFETLLAFESYPVEEVVDDDMAGLELSDPHSANTLELPLAVAAAAATELRIRIDFDPRRFAATTIRRLLGHLAALLTEIARDAERGAPALSMLAPGERHQLLVEWNDTHAEAGAWRPVHELFEAQVADGPERIALVDGDRAWSYAELDARADRLAWRLRAAGIQPGGVVALGAERSLEMVAGLLATFKAGGVFLPLEPSLPAERLRFMVEDALGAGKERAAVPVLLTQERLRSFWSELGPPLEVLAIDPEAPAGGRAGIEERPRRRVAPEALAYLIYTSGSTGRPKAVRVRHGGLSSLLQATRAAFDFRPGDRMPCLASCSFDIFLFELLSPLLAGGTSVLLPAPPALGLGRLAELLADVSHLHAVPALMRQLLGELPEAGRETRGPSRLRAILTGGDRVPDRLLADLRRSFPHARTWVLYGPTEATILASSHRVPASGRAEGLLGRPLPNVELRLYDGHPEPVPIGVAGEIYIGGAGVAEGYLGRPRLSAEKLVAVDGRPFFRSGDRARRLAGGELEFLGRLDDQVKVRGFRIELGEVEAVLAAHPAAREAAVVAAAGADGERSLVAYWVAAEAAAADGDQLRAFAAGKLPPYMVPGAFVELEALPLTVHGKVDRAALGRRALAERPAPAAERAPGERPGDPIAELLCEIWAEVLGLPEVGVEDDFFALGGHSLLAMSAVSRIRRAFGVEVPLRALFESPTVSGLRRRLEAALRGDRAPVAPLRPVSREGELPLSFAQQRLWFLAQLEPESSAYNMPYAVRWTGPIEVAALAVALRALVERHEALRTTFAERGGQAVQVISPRARAALPVIDLGGLGEAVRGALAERLAVAEARRPFDLERGPLLRTALLRLEGGEHRLLITLHHVVSDGVSMGLFVRELAALYRACLGGEPAPLAPLEVQYADFAQWQRRWLRGEALESQLSYWRRQLAGPLPVLELPRDGARRAARSFRGASVSRRLSRELSAALRSLGRKRGATLFMVLLAAFKVLLQRLSGEEDVVVGTPIAGRTRVEVEPLIGFFLNTLALRTDLSGAPSFLELIGRVREVALGAYAHQEIPFEKLVEELAPERDLSRTPLFQVFFNLADLPREAIELPDGVVLEPLGHGAPQSKFDLTLYARQAEGEIRLLAIYDAELFTAARMEEMLGQLELLLAQVAERPGEAIDRYSLMTPAAERLLPDPSLSLEVPVFEPLARRLLAQARRSRERPAVIGGPAGVEEVWSYGELAAEGLRIAGGLRARGVARGEVVALVGARGRELIAGVVGVFLAGGVLLLLDRRLPEARLRRMLAEAGARRLISAGGERAEDAWMESEAGLEVLAAAELAEEARPLEAAEVAEPGPDDPVYVFFTSGTTGVPKGVVGRHKGLCHFLAWQRERFGIGEGDRVAQLTGLGFDVVLRDLLLPLASGAAICLPPEDELLPEQVVPWLEASGITALHAVPSLAALWLERAPAGPSLGSLRWVFFAGEPLTEGLVRRWRRRFPAAGEVVNLYGPTETTLAKCFYVVPEEPVSGVQPIGAALPQAQALVLAGEDRRCGIGEVGEIAIRTPFRSLGYLGAAAGEASRFRRNRYGRAGDDLLYLTGDRGRYRPDGSLEILGRLDDQVKVRGMRVELAEVRRALEAEPRVGRAEVVLRELAAGDRRLVAYVVPAPGVPGASVAADELRRELRRELPDYMVPSFFVVLEALPLGANGKVDRGRLPLPEPVRGSSGSAFEAPRTPVEEVVAAVWREVLGVEELGVSDHFFDLGGHSLLAMRVVSRLRESLRVELPLRALFEAPTVAGLAARVEAARRAAAATAGPIERRAEAGEALPLSFAQQRLWFIDRLDPGKPAYNLPLSLRLEGSLDAAVLERVFREVERRHEVLRTRIATAGGEPRQVVEEVALRLAVVDLGGLEPVAREAELERLARAESRRPFDLARGPLWRASLVRLGPEDHALLATLHHVVGDVWSLWVLHREVVVLYRAFSRGEPSPLAELPIQYGDYALWQQHQERSGVLAAQLEYWRRRLEGLRVLELPSDRAARSERDFAGAEESRTLGAEACRRLDGLCRGEGVSLFMVLVAALDVVFWHDTGQGDVALGANVANRSRRETEELIGCFLNMVVLRAQLRPEESFRELLGRVREDVLGAFAHEDLPFDRLVRALRPDRDADSQPLFRVLVDLQSPLGEAGELPGMRLRALGAKTGLTHFDLTFHFTRHAERLVMRLRYRAGLFEGARMARVLDELTQVLEAVVESPESRLEALAGQLGESRAARRAAAGEQLKARARRTLRRLDRPATLDEEKASLAR